MEQGNPNRAKQARYLRKQQKQAGQDDMEDQEDQVFKQDVEKAIKTHAKGGINKNVQQQVEYFGFKMEPFNMKQQEQMGDIDGDGYFVFSRKRKFKDAWLDSLQNEQDDQAVDNIRKKIKQEHRAKNVFDDQEYKSRIKEQSNSEQENEEQAQDEAGQQDQDQRKDKFSGKQIKQILAQLLPFGTNANQYMKKLKKDKDTELYQKILYLCNSYVESTSQYDIFTLKKEDLQQELQQKQDAAPIQNWDKDSESQPQEQQPNIKNQIKSHEKNEQKDEDDIF